MSEEIIRYEEVSPTAKLWRYMDLAKFISLIGKKKLYFASLESFEDIFEGAKGTVNRKGIWDGFYSDFFKKAIQTVPGMNREDLTDEYIEKNSMRLLSEWGAMGELERKNVFVSCWHCNQYESDAMWKLYSANVKNALAIQTTGRQLFEALGKDPSVEIGKVRYIDYTKQFAPINGAYWYKRKSFEYEQEVRAVTHVRKAACCGVEKDVEIEKLIAGVYISPYAPKWFEDVVRDITEKYGLNKPIFYSEMKTSVYKGYKRDKIEMRGDRAEMSDFPLYLNTVAGGLDRRDQTIGGFSFVVKIYAVPVVEIIG